MTTGSPIQIPVAVRAEVASVYDYGQETIDRYTIVMRDQRTCLGVSDDPEHPQGFSQFSECRVGPHLGQKISLETLPPQVLRHVIRRLVD